MYHQFASSYPAIQSISQAKLHTKSQKAEIQTMEATEHLLLCNHKTQAQSLSSGSFPWRVLLDVDSEGMKEESVGSKTQQSRLWDWI